MLMRLREAALQLWRRAPVHVASPHRTLVLVALLVTLVLLLAAGSSSPTSAPPAAVRKRIPDSGKEHFRGGGKLSVHVVHEVGISLDGSADSGASHSDDRKGGRGVPSSGSSNGTMCIRRDLLFVPDSLHAAFVVEFIPSVSSSSSSASASSAGAAEAEAEASAAGESAEVLAALSQEAAVMARTSAAFVRSPLAKGGSPADDAAEFNLALAATLAEAALEEWEEQEEDETLTFVGVQKSEEAEVNAAASDNGIGGRSSSKSHRGDGGGHAMRAGAVGSPIAPSQWSEGMSIAPSVLILDDRSRPSVRRATGSCWLREALAAAAAESPSASLIVTQQQQTHIGGTNSNAAPRHQMAPATRPISLDDIDVGGGGDEVAHTNNGGAVSSKFSDRMGVVKKDSAAPTDVVGKGTGNYDDTFEYFGSSLQRHRWGRQGSDAALAFRALDRAVCQNYPEHHPDYATAMEMIASVAAGGTQSQTPSTVATTLPLPLGAEIPQQQQQSANEGNSSSSTSSVIASALALLPAHPPTSLAHRLPHRGRYGSHESMSLHLYRLPLSPPALHDPQRPRTAAVITDILSKNPNENPSNTNNPSPMPAATASGSRYSVLEEFPFLQQMACPLPPRTKAIRRQRRCETPPRNDVPPTKRNTAVVVGSSDRMRRAEVRGNMLFLPANAAKSADSAECGGVVAPHVSSGGALRRFPFAPFTCRTHRSTTEGAASSSATAADPIAPTNNSPNSVDGGVASSSSSDGPQLAAQQVHAQQQEAEGRALLRRIEDTVSYGEPLLTPVTVGTGSAFVNDPQQTQTAITSARSRGTASREKELCPYAAIKAAVTRSVRRFRAYYRGAFIEAERWAAERRSAEEEGEDESIEQEQKEGVYTAAANQSILRKGTAPPFPLPLGPHSIPPGPSVLRATCGAWAEGGANGYVRWSPAAANCTAQLNQLAESEDRENDASLARTLPPISKVIESHTAVGRTTKISAPLPFPYPVAGYSALMEGLLQTAAGGLTSGSSGDRYLWGHAEGDSSFVATASSHQAKSREEEEGEGGVPSPSVQQQQQVASETDALRQQLKTPKEGATAAVADAMRGFIRQRLLAEEAARLKRWEQLHRRATAEEMQHRRSLRRRAGKGKTGVKQQKEEDKDEVPPPPPSPALSDRQHITLLFWGDSTVRGAFCSAMNHLLRFLPGARSTGKGGGGWCDPKAIHNVPIGDRCIEAFLPAAASLYFGSATARARHQTSANNKNSPTTPAPFHIGGGGGGAKGAPQPFDPAASLASFGESITSFFTSVPIRLTVSLVFFSSPYFGEELAAQTLQFSPGVGIEALLAYFYPPASLAAVAAAGDNGVNSGVAAAGGGGNASAMHLVEDSPLSFTVPNVSPTAAVAANFAQRLRSAQRALMPPGAPLPLPSLVYCGKGMWDGLRVTSGAPDDRLFMSAEQLGLGLYGGKGKKIARRRETEGGGKTPNTNTAKGEAAAKTPRASFSIYRHNAALLEHSLLIERTVAEALVAVAAVFPHAALLTQGAQHVVPPLLFEKTGFTFCTASFVKGYWRRRLFAATRLFNGFVASEEEAKAKVTRKRIVAHSARANAVLGDDSSKMAQSSRASFLSPTAHQLTPRAFYIDYSSLTETMARHFFTKGDGVHLEHPLLGLMTGLAVSDVGVQTLTAPLPRGNGNAANGEHNGNALLSERQQPNTPSGAFIGVDSGSGLGRQWTLQPRPLAPSALWALLFQGTDPLLGHRMYHTPTPPAADARLDDGDKVKTEGLYERPVPRALRRPIGLVFVSSSNAVGAAAQPQGEETAAAAAAAVVVTPRFLPPASARLSYPSHKSFPLPLSTCSAAPPPSPLGS